MDLVRKGEGGLSEERREWCSDRNGGVGLAA